MARPSPSSAGCSRWTCERDDLRAARRAPEALVLERREHADQLGVDLRRELLGRACTRLELPALRGESAYDCRESVRETPRIGLRERRVQVARGLCGELPGIAGPAWRAAGPTPHHPRGDRCEQCERTPRDPARSDRLVRRRCRPDVEERLSLR
jgi:hypothetical protein